MAGHPHTSYSIGVVCALAREDAAMVEMLDERHPRLARQVRDTNSYTLGSIGPHNVVITCLPKGVYGTTEAAISANNMIRTFTEVKLILMVGICGGVPSKSNDIRLGDVIISQPTGDKPGVVQFDMGKTVQGGKTEHTGSLSPPPRILLSDLSLLAAKHETDGQKIDKHMEVFRRTPELHRRFQRPPTDQDRLFEAGYSHVGGETCESCDPSMTVHRQGREDGSIEIFYGTLASGNQVMKDSGERDRIAKQYGVLGFEMEAAGLMNNFDCGIIRGVCDYCDSHKNKQWQDYAAAAAAAYAKELLLFMDPQPVAELDVILQKPPDNEQRRASVVDAVGQQSGRGIGKFVSKYTQRDPDAESKREHPDDALRRYRRKLLDSNPNDDRVKLMHSKGGPPIKDTCEWIIDDPCFQSWYQGQPPLLWISGNPGRGKTMISLFLDRHLRNNAEGNSQAISYFCAEEDGKRNNDVSIMRGLLWQIVDGALDCDDTGRKKCIQRHFAAQEKTPDHFSQNQSLWRTFAALIADAAMEPIFCIIDALDECDVHSRKWIVEKFEDLLCSDSDLTTKKNLQVIMVSRDIPPLRAACSRLVHIDLETPEHDPQVQQDIERVVSERLQNFVHIPGFDEDFKQSLQKDLVERAEGSFVHVELAFLDLENETTCSDLHDKVRELPKGLSRFYGRILLQIKERDKLPEILRVLRLVTCAVRPLTLKELGESLRMQTSIPGTSFSENKLMRTNSNVDIEEHVARCQPLLKLKGDTVVFFQLSAKEFLLSNDSKIEGVEEFHIDAEVTNLRAAEGCLDYIQRSPVQKSPVVSNTDRAWDAWPNLRYAVAHWPIHAQRSGGRAGELLNKAGKWLFEEKSSVRLNWWQTYVWVQSQGQERPQELTLHGDEERVHQKQSWQVSKMQREMDKTVPPPLHMACRFGLSEWVRKRLDGIKKENLKRLLDTGDAYGVQPLTWAAMEGHEEVVKVLLDHDADANIMASLEKRTALSSMTFGRKFRSYIREITHGDALWTGKHTALYRAAYRGHLAVVQTLLQAQANPNIKEWADFTSLHAAAMGGNEDIMRALLLNGGTQSVNAALNVTLITPLQYAAQGNNIEVARLLLNEGANVWMKQRNTWYTSLHCAVEGNASTELVKMLLVEGAKEVSEEVAKEQIRVRTLFGEEAIHIAAKHANEGTIELLIEHGALVNATDFFDVDTPLHAAVRYGRTSVAEVLLNAGASIESGNVAGKTALHLGAEQAYTKIIRLLFEHDANVNSKAENGNTPLHLAARSATESELDDFKDTIQLLIDNKARINAKNDKGQTPLDKAVNFGNNSLIELLRSYGAVLQAPKKGLRDKYPELFKPLPNMAARVSSLSLTTIRSVSPSGSTMDNETAKADHALATDEPMLDQLSLSNGETAINDEPESMEKNERSMRSIGTDEIDHAVDAKSG